MNYQTSGAISGGASGAQAGMSIGGPWGAAGGALVGAGLGAIGGSAQEHAARRAARLRAMQLAAQNQVTGFQNADNAVQQERLRSLMAQRYAAYGQLANQLGGPERAAAGQQAGLDAQSRLSGAMGSVNATPVGNRALVGGGASDLAIQGQLAPLLAARRAALVANREQGGMERYDTGAMNQAQNTSLDLNRQAQEAAQQANVMAALRRRMLTQAGVQYVDSGPTNGELNQQMLAALGQAGLQLAGGYGNISRENAGSSMDAERLAELRARRIGNANGGF